MSNKLSYKVRVYQHSHFKLSKWVLHAWANVIIVAVICGGLYFRWDDAPIEFIVFAIGIVFVAIFTAVGRYYQLNNRLVVTLYEKGLTASGSLHVYTSKRGAVEYKWDEIEKVAQPQPDWVEQRLVGFHIYFTDGEKLLIPQSIDGYEELYGEFKNRNIQGSDHILNIYPIDYYGDMAGRFSAH